MSSKLRSARTTSGAGLCGARGEVSHRRTSMVTTGGICPGSPIIRNRSLTVAHCIRSAHAICHASSIASRSYGPAWAGRLVSAHFAVVAIVTPALVGRALLSTSHWTLEGKSPGVRAPALANRATDTSGWSRANRLHMSSAWLLVCAATAIRFPSRARADSTSMRVCVLPEPGGAFTIASRPPPTMYSVSARSSSTYSASIVSRLTPPHRSRSARHRR